MGECFDPVGLAPLPGMALPEDSGAGSSFCARDALGSAQLPLGLHREWRGFRKMNLLAFPCLNLVGHIFQGFSQPVKI